MRAGVLVFLASLMLAAGCTTTEQRVSGDIRNVSDVTINLRVEPARTTVGRPVRLSLSLMNNSGRPRDLRFPTAQRYDFWVTQGGRPLWRWSQGAVIADQPTSLEIGGQTGTQFTETWTPSAPGSYEVHGEITADGFAGDLTAQLVVEES